MLQSEGIETLSKISYIEKRKPNELEMDGNAYTVYHVVYTLCRSGEGRVLSIRNVWKNPEAT